MCSVHNFIWINLQAWHARDACNRCYIALIAICRYTTIGNRSAYSLVRCCWRWLNRSLLQRKRSMSSFHSISVLLNYTNVDDGQRYSSAFCVRQLHETKFETWQTFNLTFDAWLRFVEKCNFRFGGSSRDIHRNRNALRAYCAVLSMLSESSSFYSLIFRHSMSESNTEFGFCSSVNASLLYCLNSSFFGHRKSCYKSTVSNLCTHAPKCISPFAVPNNCYFIIPFKSATSSRMPYLTANDGPWIETIDHH